MPLSDYFSYLKIHVVFIYFKIFIYLFIWLHRVLAAAHRIVDLCCGTWDLLVVVCKLLVEAHGT